MSSGFGPAAPIFRVSRVRASLDYFLRFISEPKRGLPYGEFLDANGTRWNQAESAG